MVVAVSVPANANAPVTLILPNDAAAAIGKKSVPDCVRPLVNDIVPLVALIVPDAVLLTGTPTVDVPVPALLEKMPLLVMLATPVLR